MSINFTKGIQSIEVPIYFFVGKHDMITPAVLVEKFYKPLEARNGKKLFIFENSAHFMMMEEKKKYQKMLSKKNH